VETVGTGGGRRRESIHDGKTGNRAEDDEAANQKGKAQRGERVLRKDRKTGVIESDGKPEISPEPESDQDRRGAHEVRPYVLFPLPFNYTP
jgi:hypothetical protein